MKKSGFSGMSLTIVVLFISLMLGNAEAGTVRIENMTPAIAGSTMTFDLVISEVDLGEIAGWSLGMQLTGTGSASFVADPELTTEAPNYLFYDNSFIFISNVTSGGAHIDLGDYYESVYVAASDAVDRLLVRMEIDLSTALLGESYQISISSDSIFNNSVFEVEPLTFSGASSYNFNVVPIPNTLWILGPALLGLAVLRRKYSE